ncbi:MAG: hypothetical protein OEZ10_13850 [Gammaproteobacteria bacterium]|nr:hypothetical protein [Gammaproteobacteria bacterium]
MRSILTGLMVFLLTALSVTHANVVVLKPSGSGNQYGGLNGAVGLAAESLQGGTVLFTAGAASSSAQLGADGQFNVVTGAGSNINVIASLVPEGMPPVSMSFSNIPALADKEVRTLDLVRASGRIVGRVTVIGGTLESISFSATANTVMGGVTERYRSSVNVNRSGTANPEAWLAMPSGIATQVSAQVQALSTRGCTVSQGAAPQTVTVTDGLVAPTVVHWIINISSQPCVMTNVSGQFRLNGLDPSAQLQQHTALFSGPEFYSLDFTRPGSYSISPVTTGVYSLAQTSVFQPPYGELGYANKSVVVSGATVVDLVEAVATAHGSVVLNGEWGFADVQSATIDPAGLGATPADTLFASDNLDPGNGQFDLVLATGTWDINQYGFRFVEVLAGRDNTFSLNLDLPVVTGVNQHTLTTGQWLNMAPLVLDTAKADVDVQVEQLPGQPAVTVNTVSINGGAMLLDPNTGLPAGTVSVSATSSGNAAASVRMSIYGLPGTYSLVATGLGSDGLLYRAPFVLTLGPAAPPPGPGPMQCFGINTMKVQFHDDKIYINDAVFSVTGETPDLSAEDVVVMIDGLEYRIPAGSFRQSGEGQRYRFRTAEAEKPSIRMSLDFDKMRWSIKIRDDDVGRVDNNDGVDIGLAIGSYRGAESIVMKTKHGHEAGLWYKRKPRLRCGDTNDDDHKDDDHEHDRDRDDHKDDKKGHKGKYSPKKMK